MQIMPKYDLVSYTMGTPCAELYANVVCVGDGRAVEGYAGVTGQE